MQQKNDSVKQPQSKLASSFEQTKKLLDKEPPKSTEIFIHVIVSHAMEILMKRQYGYTASVGKSYQALKNDADFRDILQDLVAKDGNLLNKGAIVKMAKYSWRERIYKATHVNGLTNFQKLLSDGIELLESMGQLDYWMRYRLNFMKAVLQYTEEPQYAAHLAEELEDKAQDELDAAELKVHFATEASPDPCHDETDLVRALGKASTK